MSKQVKHTPGPWHWDGNPSNYNPNEEAPWLCGLNDRGEETAVLTGEIEAVNVADVLLIAAAPDLLDALQESQMLIAQLSGYLQAQGDRTYLDRIFKRLDANRPVIAKAEGAL